MKKDDGSADEWAEYIWVSANFDVVEVDTDRDGFLETIAFDRSNEGAIVEIVEVDSEWTYTAYEPYTGPGEVNRGEESEESSRDG